MLSAQSNLSRLTTASEPRTRAAHPLPSVLVTPLSTSLLTGSVSVGDPAVPTAVFMTDVACWREQSTCLRPSSRLSKRLATAQAVHLVCVCFSTRAPAIPTWRSVPGDELLSLHITLHYPVHLPQCSPFACHPMPFVSPVSPSIYLTCSLAPCLSDRAPNPVRASLEC
jgi:hypothetical protein